MQFKEEHLDLRSRFAHTRGELRTWQFRKLRFAFLAVFSAFTLGCGSEPQPAPQPTPEIQQVNYTAPAIVVPGSVEWTDTGVEVIQGDSVSVEASGNVQCRTTKGAKDIPTSFGPAGTFHFTNEEAVQSFPLPSGASGPAPCYCLIGRIDDGAPFFIGSKQSWTSKETGRLWLGVNDFKHDDNTGEFHVSIDSLKLPQPLALEQRLIDSGLAAIADRKRAGLPSIPVFTSFETAHENRSASEPAIIGSRLNGIASHTQTPRPAIPKASVVVFYVDGLRPDVVREMAAMGHLPVIRKHFVDGGAWLSNCFTGFPSDTITSNGTMWTGCFSDRHGLKGQVRFSRRSLSSQSYLEPLGPNRSAQLLSPQGVDRLIHKAHELTIGAISGNESATRWSQQRTTGVPPIYARLRQNGADWATGILPMMTEVPPVLWTRSLVKHMPLLRSHEASDYIDNANTDFAIRHLLTPHRQANSNRPVTILWLPETDTISHKKSRGQFGMTRRTIAEADVLIGKVIDELRVRGQLKSTYLMLVSDHGHHGGQTKHLANFDLANHMFFRPREVDEQGNWVGGGLGMSVRMHRFWNRHPDDGTKDFVFIDGDSDGAARIFLPRDRFRSGRWMGKSSPGKLLAYEVADNRPPVNLLQALTRSRMQNASGKIEHPMDLALVKLSESSVLIHTADRGDAVIDRQRSGDANGWVYRYQVVTNLRATADGNIATDVVSSPRVDPLGILDVLLPAELAEYRDESEWLRLSISTPYPDGVVTMTRHMLWQENLKHREGEYAPDIVVTARPGWFFGRDSSPGTMHGYPTHDAMRASWFVSGPGVRKGVTIESPCRLVDLTPTILELTGIQTEPGEMDGSPLRTIYEDDESYDFQLVSRPLYWNQIDLAAWRRVAYEPIDRYPHLPLTSNHPDHPLDINNITYNLIAIGDWNVAQLLDSMVAPLSGKPRLMSGAIENLESSVRTHGPGWAAEGMSVVNVSGLAVSDYSVTSLGNLGRIDSAVDWIQNRSLSIDGRLAGPLGQDHLPGVTQTHKVIDGVQNTFWEVYRFGQRVVVQLLDETLMNGLENRTDRTMNAFRSIPSEIPATRER